MFALLVYPTRNTFPGIKLNAVTSLLSASLTQPQHRAVTSERRAASGRYCSQPMKRRLSRTSKVRYRHPKYWQRFVHGS